MLLAGEAHIADLPRELHGRRAGRKGMEIISSQNPGDAGHGVPNGLYQSTGDPALQRPTCPGPISASARR
jgi:hypothetical protein